MRLGAVPFVVQSLAKSEPAADSEKPSSSQPGIRSKYEIWHDAIIDRARSRCLSAYKETHHIYPRSFGGSDDPANLVDLTYREHFLIHWLLTRICAGNQKRKMVHAFHAMTLCANGTRAIASWQFEVAKRVLANAVRERMAERKRLQVQRDADRLRQSQEARAASKLVTKAFLDKTPWRAKKMQTVLRVHEETKALIAETVSGVRLSGAAGKQTVSDLAKIWIQCDGETSQVEST